jgi:hypothetical protein
MARAKRTIGKHSNDDDPPPARSGPGPGPGRPRLTPEAFRERVAAYCKEYDVPATAEGLPAFPSGQRETAQHREWMALYKAHRRLAERSAGPGAKDAARIQELLTAQRGRCPICRKPLDLAEARLDGPSNPAALHAPCSQLVALARSLGKDALDRAKDRL